MLTKFFLLLGVILLLVVATFGAWRLLDKAPQAVTRMDVRMDQGEPQIFPEADKSGPMNFLVIWRLQASEGEAAEQSLPSQAEPELLWVLESTEGPDLPRDTHVYSMIPWGAVPLYANQLFPAGEASPPRVKVGDNLVIMFGFWKGKRLNREPAIAVYQYEVQGREDISLVREWTHEFSHILNIPIPRDQLPESIRNSIETTFRNARQ